VNWKQNGYFLDPLDHLLVQEDDEANTAEESVLEVRVVSHEDGEHAEVRQETLDTADNVLGLDPHLAPVDVQVLVESTVVHVVVVALGQQQLLFYLSAI